MSVDLLQEKIRKLKNPSMVEFFMDKALIPPHVLDGAQSTADAYSVFCRELLAGLKGIVPAVRFRMGSFVLFGAAGMQVLSAMMEYARELGFYVVLDAPELLSPAAAQNTAAAWAEGIACDAMIVSAYLGSDILRPFVPLCKQGKALFTVVRSANKSASELQDLLTGSRLLHTAAAGVVERYMDGTLGKFGYSQFGALVGATAADSIRSLRVKFSRMFFVIDGYDYSGASAKNCSNGFDKFGRGAVVCAGTSVTAAWKETPERSTEYVQLAAEAAARMKKSLTRYVTVL